MPVPTGGSPPAHSQPLATELGAERPAKVAKRSSGSSGGDGVAPAKEEAGVDSLDAFMIGMAAKEEDDHVSSWKRGAHPCPEPVMAFLSKGVIGAVQCSAAL